MFFFSKTCYFGDISASKYIKPKIRKQSQWQSQLQ